MRVLHVNKFVYRRGGAESYMLDVAALQRTAGHDVEVWGMEHPDNPTGLALADTFAPHVQLEPAPSGGRAKLSAAARMVWSPASASGLAAALERFVPDVVHAHNVYHQLSPSILRECHRRGVPVVMTLHDYKLVCPNYQLLDHGRLCELCVTSGAWHAAAQRCKDDSLAASGVLSVESTIHRLARAYSTVELFIAPSAFLAGTIARSGRHRGKVRVINHFVELGARGAGTGSAAEWVARRTTEPSIVFAGRLSPEKGCDVLVEAMAMVPVAATLHIAGSGPDEPALRALVERVPSGRVVMHGRLPKERVQALMGSALATVVPSRWHENQPMTILESFGLSTPVVCTPLGGMPELVRDGLEGHVVPADDVAALATAITRLVQDPPHAAGLGLTARRRAEADFTVTRHVAALDEAYVGALASARGRLVG